MLKRESLIASDFRVDTGAGKTVLFRCTLTSAGFPDNLSFEVATDDPGGLEMGEANWAAVALLYPAMLAGRDLVINADLSPRLFTAMRGDLQALLVAYHRRLKRIDLEAGVSGVCSREVEGRGVATGFSAGVDSFATLKCYAGNAVPHQQQVTHLTVHDVGAFGHMQDPAVAFRMASERCRRFAARRGRSMFCVKSNLGEVFAASCLPFTAFENTHTLRNVSAAFLFQEKIHTFLYSSAYPYSEIGLTPRRVGKTLSMGTIDPILLPLLSTERFTLLSAGAGLSRVEKTALIAKDLDAQRMLDVCVGTEAMRNAVHRPNCSACWKCIRTMATLDALGSLEAFEESFNVGFYRAHRVRFLEKLQARARGGSVLDQEVVTFLRERGFSLPMPLSSVFRKISDVGHRAKRRFMKAVR